MLVITYRLNVLYLVRRETCYQSFEGSLYGLVCFYNKCALIKETVKVNNDVYNIATNFIVPKIRFVPYSVKHISATAQ